MTAVPETVSALIENVRKEARELWYEVESRRTRVKAAGIQARLLYDEYYRDAWRRLWPTD